MLCELHQLYKVDLTKEKNVVITNFENIFLQCEDTNMGSVSYTSVLYYCAIIV